MDECSNSYLSFEVQSLCNNYHIYRCIDSYQLMYLCSELFRNLLFLGIPRTLALAQVGAAISTVPQWATVEMAAPTWARARVRVNINLVVALN